MTKTIQVTCDIWHTDYNSDNWETEFMTNFVFWQLRVTLDSIRNSCDVLPFDNDITEMTISSEVWINSKKIQWYLQIIRYYPLPAGLMISDLLLLIFYFAPSPFLMIPKDLITSSNPKASDDLIPSDNLIIQWNPINEFDQKGKVLLGEIISLKLDYCYCQINLNWSFNCLPLKLCLCEICKRLSCAVGIGNNCMHLWLLYRHQVQQNNYTNHSCGAQRNLPQFYL